MNTTQAKQRLTDITVEVAQAIAEVDGAREAVSAGEATEKDVVRAQRALAKAQDRQEQAKVDLRIATRREEQAAEVAAQEAARIRRELDRITRQKAEVEAEKYREFLESVKAAAAGFNQRIGQYEQQLGYRSIVVPGRFTSFGLMDQALNDQLQRFTKPTNYGEAM